MPTHFHFLVLLKALDIERVKKNFRILLSSYTKAISNRYNRHGSLFQEHTKAKLIDSEGYLLTALTYIHQNPVRAGLVHDLGDWPHSSYLEYMGLRQNSYLNMRIVRNSFPSMADFLDFSNQMIQSIPEKYWV
jgi:putative transposase